MRMRKVLALAMAAAVAAGTLVSNVSVFADGVLVYPELILTRHDLSVTASSGLLPPHHCQLLSGSWGLCLSAEVMLFLFIPGGGCPESAWCLWGPLSWLSGWVPEFVAQRLAA